MPIVIPHCWPGFLVSHSGVVLLLSSLVCVQTTVADHEPGLYELQASVRQVVNRTIPATVVVDCNGRGSGVLVSSDGLVLTVAHVAPTPGRPVTLTLSNGKRLAGTILGVDRGLDAAMIRVKSVDPLPFVQLASDPPLSGDWCVALGFPLSTGDVRTPTLRVGRVLAKSSDLLQTDCPLAAGDSGGPLLDLEGRVVGIHRQIAKGAAGNQHVRSDQFHNHWQRFLSAESWESRPEPTRVDESTPTRDGAAIRQAMKPVIGTAERCVAQIFDGNQQIALGTILTEHRVIVTKSSLLTREFLTCAVGNEEFPAKITRRIPQLDLAVLSMPQFIQRSVIHRAADVQMGTIVLSSQRNATFRLGVVSLPRRDIPQRTGSLGITLKSAAEVIIDQVTPGSTAATAHLNSGDRIIAVDDHRITDAVSLGEALAGANAGDLLTLRVERDGQQVSAVLRLDHPLADRFNREEFEDGAAGQLSDRRTGFKGVIPHDTNITATECGGPVLDLSGNLIGVNIARATRSSTYALPVQLILDAVSTE